MDPAVSRIPGEPEGCSPARVDSPDSTPRPPRSTSLLPRARGWPTRDVPLPAQFDVAPPRTGMDRPRPSCSTRSWSRSPARGDGPSAVGLLTTTAPSLPRARGWTAPFHRSPKRNPVAPPRAGMDPSPPRCWQDAEGRSPARGDGPPFLHRCNHFDSWSSCPTHTVMAPSPSFTVFLGWPYESEPMIGKFKSPFARHLPGWSQVREFEPSLDDQSKRILVHTNAADRPVAAPRPWP